jgi:hypothetical protein
LPDKLGWNSQNFLPSILRLFLKKGLTLQEKNVLKIDHPFDMTLLRKE